MTKTKPSSRTRGFIVCIKRGGYRIDLQIGRLYRTAKPLKNDPPSMLRVIDDSGEDYLYPADWFVAVEAPANARRKLAAAASVGPE